MECLDGLTPTLPLRKLVEADQEKKDLTSKAGLSQSLFPTFLHQEAYLQSGVYNRQTAPFENRYMRR
jgi:hypothetical protein